MLKETQIFEKEEEAYFANISYLCSYEADYSKYFADITSLIYVISNSGTSII